MGVKMDGDGNTVLLGLSYNNKEKKWILLCGDGKTKEHSRDWDPETTKKDHVVILLRNGSQGTAYVDGQPVGDAQCKSDNTNLKEISHFYIGGDGDKTRSQEDVSVTVTNFLLYNRPLTFSGGNAEVEEVTDSQLAEPASPLWQGIKMRRLL
ncbi:hypothetical protein TCDM_11556 [Trypanosoma cruzi Dm28c]|uniref:Trans-sialidase C-terminal domain-containing protein n=1 Tax=Trypanosoma cruzi Dm28c TaxID=1416333 RepID=V5AJQ9_TRYCR|nr:hypothetical protein TCDM_11556 [Trypanosoma cruzi Dm28c]